MRAASPVKRLPMKPLPFYSLFAALFLVAGLLGHVVPALAQEQPDSTVEDTQDEEAGTTSPQIKTLPPAYEDQLMRLSEILGALHYLRNLCGTGEGQAWREEMQKLIAAEKPSEQSQAQMIAAFNRGFRGYAEIHRECNDPAIEAANQFLAQGTRIAAEIPNRYGR